MEAFATIVTVLLTARRVVGIARRLMGMQPVLPAGIGWLRRGWSLGAVIAGLAGHVARRGSTADDWQAAAGMGAIPSPAGCAVAVLAAVALLALLGLLVVRRRLTRPSSG
jgi:hypothetical protein